MRASARLREGREREKKQCRKNTAGSLKDHIASANNYLYKSKFTTTNHFSNEIVRIFLLFFILCKISWENTLDEENFTLFFFFFFDPIDSFKISSIRLYELISPPPQKKGRLSVGFEGLIFICRIASKFLRVIRTDLLRAGGNVRCFGAKLSPREISKMYRKYEGGKETWSTIL